jgi:hypothetical protein
MNTITRYSPRPLQHNVYVTRKTNAPENASSRIVFSSDVQFCCIDKTASNLVPSIAIFNLGNKKSAGAKSGGVGWME